MTKQLLAALVSLTLIACGNPIAPESEDVSDSSSEAELKAANTLKASAQVARKPAPPPPAPAAWKAQVSATATNPVFKTSFPIATTYDLFVAADIPKLTGQHVAIYEISSPDGSVYQRTEVPFSTGTATTYRVWTSMPVAGTWIQMFAMTGTWTVRVFLDSETVSRASQTFSLQ